MKRDRKTWFVAVVAAALSATAWAGDYARAEAEFRAYVAAAEKSMGTRSPDLSRIEAGKVAVEEQQGSPKKVDGALIHHWRGSMLVRGATIADVMAVARDFSRFPQYYAPQVVRVKVVSDGPGGTTLQMRMREHKVITVVLDATYQVRFGQPDAPRAWSESKSVQVREVENAGERDEKQVPSADGHGFLLAMNTYWRYTQTAAGVVAECESISLSRDVPRGLGWVVNPIIDDMPRERMETTMTKTRAAVEQYVAAKKQRSAR